MREMFYDCASLTHLDLSNFDSNNVKDNNNLFGMFGGCKSLKDENIIVKDKRILNAKLL